MQKEIPIKSLVLLQLCLQCIVTCGSVSVKWFNDSYNLLLCTEEAKSLISDVNNILHQIYVIIDIDGRCMKM